MPQVRRYVVVRREALLEKVCPVCGMAFEGLSRRRYCSRACLNRANYLRHGDQKRAARRARYRRQKEQHP